eukprot:s1864_g1.t1
MDHLRRQWKKVFQIRHLPPEHAQYFLTYLAQGISRVGKDYLKSSAAQLLSMRELQLFSNLLPEFGSLPWALKLILVRRGWASNDGPPRQHASGRPSLAMALVVTALPWLGLGLLGFLGVSVDPTTLLLSTGLASLGSAVADGLTDGLMAAESTEASAAALQSLCQTGHSIGAAWPETLAAASSTFRTFLSRVHWRVTVSSLSLMFTAAAWASILWTLRTRTRTGDTLQSDFGSEPPFSWRELAQPNVLRVAALGFFVCLAPAADTFLFRQFVLGLRSSQQPLVSIAGTVGWFIGTFAYREIARGRTATGGLRLSLLLWTLPLLAKA